MMKIKFLLVSSLVLINSITIFSSATFNNHDTKNYETISNHIFFSKAYGKVNQNTENNKSNSNTQGIVIVKVLVKNSDGVNRNSSDFVINVHGNEPHPATFKGNSSGTIVKLNMGMYSVSQGHVPQYNSSFSDDCFGGIMSIETKTCIIVNTYTKFSTQ